MSKYYLASHEQFDREKIYTIYKRSAPADIFCFRGNILECKAWIELDALGYMEV